MLLIINIVFVLSVILSVIPWFISVYFRGWLYIISLVLFLMFLLNGGLQFTRYLEDILNLPAGMIPIFIFLFLAALQFFIRCENCGTPVTAAGNMSKENEIINLGKGYYSFIIQRKCPKCGVDRKIK